MFLLFALGGCANLLGLDAYQEETPLVGGGEAEGGGGTGGGAGAGGAGGAVIPLAVSVRWTALVAGSGDAHLDGLAVDATGTTSICGTHTDAIADENGRDLVDPGSGNIFVGRIDATGVVTQVESFGDGMAQTCHDVAVDALNRTFITGEVSGTTMIAGSSKGPFTDPRVYVSRLLPDLGGTNLFVTTGGDSVQRAFGVALDPAEGLVLGGSFMGTFDSASMSVSTELTHVAAFAVRLFEPNVEWTSALGSADGNQVVWAAAVLPDRASVFVGHFEDMLVDGSVTPPESAGESDAFVATYAREGGTLERLVTFGGSLAEAALDVAVDLEGNIIVVGYYASPFSLEQETAPAADGEGVFVLKLTTDGVSWLRTFDGPGNQRATSVAVDAAGNIWLTGTNAGVVQFGDASVATTSGAGGFVLGLTSEGAVRFATGMESQTSVKPQGIDVASNGDVLVGVTLDGALSILDTVTAASDATDVAVVALQVE